MSAGEPEAGTGDVVGPYRAYGQYVPARIGGPAKFGYLIYEPTGQPGGPRLSFVTNDNEEFFGAPLSSFHSLGLADYNATLEIWEGDLRHRVCLLPGGAAQAALTAEFTGNTDAKKWFALLQPGVGAPPGGVKVHAPMSKGKRVALNYTLGCLGAIVVIVIVLFVMAFMAAR